MLSADFSQKSVEPGAAGKLFFVIRTVNLRNKICYGLQIGAVVQHHLLAADYQTAKLQFSPQNYLCVLKSATGWMFSNTHDTYFIMATTDRGEGEDQSDG